MVSLIDGKWSDTPIATMNKSGNFIRASSTFRNTIKKEDAEKERYHLYVSYACPWAHRTIIVRNLKKLEDIIPMSVTNPFMGNKGWTFGEKDNTEYLADIYRAANEQYTGKVTVPVLWDNRDETIVNNESSEIIRIFNESFNHLSSTQINFYPEELRDQIDEINDIIYKNVNNGVYKTGFAQKQTAYERACHNLFKTLEYLENILSTQKFLLGEKITEADIRLFTTLIRFDPVYYLHFKCNIKRIVDFHNLYNYLKSIYQIPEVKATCHFDHIKEHYFKSHLWINPKGIVPLGPEQHLDERHDRGKIDFFYW